MSKQQLQWAAAFALIVIALAIAGFLISDRQSLNNDAAVEQWQPAVLETEAPTSTPASGWWDEMPTPSLPTPTSIPTPTVEES